MDTIPPETNSSTQTQEQQNNSEPKKLTGFQLHPENINKNGAPKKEWTMKSLLLEVAEEEIELKNKLGVVTSRKLFKEALAKKLWHMAVNGDIQAIKEINERIDGKAPQSVDLSNNGEKFEAPIIFIPQEKHD